jgi:hypothetical protein
MLVVPDCEPVSRRLDEVIISCQRRPCPAGRAAKPAQHGQCSLKSVTLSCNDLSRLLPLNIGGARRYVEVF